MSQYVYLTFVFSCSVLIACQSENKPQKLSNPPAEGFNIEGSDAKAIAIADSVMIAMGGRDAWDQTEILKWNFFGRRTLEWNKQENTVKINLLADSIMIDLNMLTMEGEVFFKGVNQTNPDTLSKYLERGKNIWINDSYWLVMPYKLKDSGVTLKYMGIDTTASGESAHFLSLTFEDVGTTPQNKYEVAVSKEDYLVKEWRFYANATDSIPRITTPWADYQRYGEILLSGDRGRLSLTDISVSSSNKQSSQE